MTTRKKIAIVLLVIQLLLIVARASLGFNTPATGVVFFLPAIIGVALLFGKSRKD